MNRGMVTTFFVAVILFLAFQCPGGGTSGPTEPTAAVGTVPTATPYPAPTAGIELRGLNLRQGNASLRIAGRVEYLVYYSTQMDAIWVGCWPDGQLDPQNPQNPVHHVQVLDRVSQRIPETDKDPVSFDIRVDYPNPNMGLGILTLKSNGDMIFVAGVKTPRTD